MCSIIGILNNVEGIVYSVIRLLPADAIGPTGTRYDDAE